jgi:Tfp pilus assembly protein PilW
MVTVAIFMIVSGAVMKGVFDLTGVHNVIINRTDMHNGVRNATELLTQEIGQAGRIALPAPVTLNAATVVNDTTLTVSSTAGMFVGEQLIVDTGNQEETVTVNAIAGNQLTTAIGMTKAHAAAVPITAPGGFSWGVVPDNAVNGSTATTLKIFGDVNGDGNMVYVEYSCEIPNAGNGVLRRKMMPITGPKPANAPGQVLIDTVQANPGGTPCFIYQRNTAAGQTFITNVAVTLTVATVNVNRNTGVVEQETKALLNVAPRNVFNVWQLAALGITNRVQPTPASVAALLP